MGFQRRTYKLVWPDDSPWAGLEVRMRPMAVGTLEEVGTLYAKANDDAGRFALLPALAEIVQVGILSWNLEDDGGAPVPCTDVAGEGVELVTAILNAWTEAVNQVSAPLPSGSRSGGPSPEESMPMVIPSASHPSLNTPI